MKQIMRWLQLPSISLLAILALDGCKKVAPEEVITKSHAEITVLAGGGGRVGGYLDGIREKALFQYLNNMVMDAAGNIYATDQFNFRIRKISPSGVVTTLAGSGVNGYVDGTGTMAQFGDLEGLAIDALGNLYVSDYTSAVIRKITPAGVVSTYAGTGERGLMDGPVTTAKFGGLSCLVMDKTGNLFVADNDNAVIRKISSAGIVSTYAGTPQGTTYGTQQYNGPANQARFGPTLAGITVDPSGNIYVVDQLRNFIWKITPAGNASTWAGDGQQGYGGVPTFNDGFGPSAEFYSSVGLTCDSSGNIYVADQGNNRIRKITPDDLVSTVAGNGTKGVVNGPAINAQLYLPIAVVTDATGNIYFSEYNQIRKIENVTTSINIENTWNNPQSWGNPH